MQDGCGILLIDLHLFLTYLFHFIIKIKTNIGLEVNIRDAPQVYQKLTHPLCVAIVMFRILTVSYFRLLAQGNTSFVFWRFT